MKVKVLKGYVYVAPNGRLTPVHKGQVIDVTKAEAEGLIARGRAVAVETEAKPVLPKKKVV
jgi:hypothetical protein